MKRFAIALAACLLLTAAGFAQQYAIDYGSWAITGQKADTYNTFQPRSLCNTPGPKGQFFVFATNAPVFIDDPSSAKDEVQTPATVVNTGSGCGVTFSSTSYTHSSFTLRSGTAGLQEALNSLGASNASTVTVILDGRWYAQANAVPGTTAAAIIAAASGNSTIQLLDTTTAPYTTYAWNGMWYAKTGLSGSGTSQSFQGWGASSLTALAAPTATTATAAGPTGIAAATYRYGMTCVSAQAGESLLSDDAATTVTTTSPHGTITVPHPTTCPGGSVGWRLYVSAAAGAQGSEIFYAPTAAGCTQAVSSPVPACALTSNAVFSALITSTAKVPSQATAYRAVGVSSSTITQAFPTQLGPFADVGTQTAGTAYTLGEVLIPAGFLNTLNKTIRVCGMIEETTVATAVPTYAITAANERDQSPSTLLTWTTSAPGAQDNVVRFCGTIKTAATGASGTAEAHGTLLTAKADGSAAAEVWNDANAAAAVSVADLTKPVYLQITVNSAVADPTKGVLRDLQVEVLN